MKMVRNLFLTLILVSVSVFAAGIPEVKNTDNFTMGRGANGDDKEFIFNIGDGVANPKLLINDTLKVFNFNKGLDVTGAGVFSGNGEFAGDLKVGDGANSEQFMSFRVSGEEVGFKFDTATGEVLQKKKAGDAYKKLGSGSGSGSLGINGFGEDDNANAEDGTTGWTNTGTGTFIAFDITAPNEKKVIEGDKTFRFTPSAQNDVISSSVLNFDFSKFHGRTCEVGIEYTGADENLELHIVDANGLILNEDLPNNRKIPARSLTTGPFSVSFQCPTAAAIGGDANKGNLHVEIKNVGAVASLPIDWDLTFAGTDRNLGTSDLPSDFSFRLDTGAGTLARNDGGVVSGCSVNGTGDSSCTFIDLSNTPELVCTSETSPVNVDFFDGTLLNTGVRIRSTNVSGTSSNVWVSCIGKKTGSDRNKTVNTYKASPVTSETVNEFSMALSTTTVSGENIDWINGNCSSNGTGDKTCNFNAGIFSATPNCTATMESFGPLSNPTWTVQPSSSSVRLRTWINGVASDANIYVKCQKQGADFVKPQTKNLSLAGIAVNSYAESSQAQMRVESCTVSMGGGTPSSGNQKCNSWIDSYSDNGAGDYTANYITGIFSGTPACTCTAIETGAITRDCTIAGTNGAIATRFFVSGGGSSTAGIDRSTNIICVGEK